MLKIFRKLFTVAFSLLLASVLFAEESLPTGFKNIHFGMSVDEVKEELFEIVSDKVAKEYLLYILNKGDKNE